MVFLIGWLTRMVPVCGVDHIHNVFFLMEFKTWYVLVCWYDNIKIIVILYDEYINYVINYITKI